MVTFDDTGMILTKLLLQVSDAAGKKCALSSMHAQLRWLNPNPGWKIQAGHILGLNALALLFTLVLSQTHSQLLISLIVLSASLVSIARLYYLRLQRSSMIASVQEALLDQTIPDKKVAEIFAKLRLEFTDKNNIRHIDNAFAVWKVYLG